MSVAASGLTGMARIKRTIVGWLVPISLGIGAWLLLDIVKEFYGSEIGMSAAAIIIVFGIALYRYLDGPPKSNKP